MTAPNAKPRAGEHVPSRTDLIEGDLLAEFRYCEASFNGMAEHARQLEAERDALAARVKELEAQLATSSSKGR